MNIFLLAALILAPTLGPTPGIYDSLQLAVNPATGIITGSFFDQTAGGQFTCGFLLYSDGKPSTDGVYRIITWSPNPGDEQEIVSGILRFVGESAVLKLPKQAHGGCWNVNPELDRGEETTLTFETRKAWREERMIKDQKVWFYSRPDRSAKTASYVVTGDSVAVTDRRGDWLHVDYVGSSRKTKSGWIQNDGLYPVLPPKAQSEKK